MALIDWTDRLVLNIEEVDRQHQELVAIINDLHAAMFDGRDRESVAWTLAALTSYTRFHFGFEERLLAQHDYPDTHDHTLEHRMFVRTLGDFKNAHSKGTAGLSVSLMAFLANWLHNHIAGTDQRYVSYLAARGIR